MKGNQLVKCEKLRPRNTYLEDYAVEIKDWERDWARGGGQGWGL